MELPGHHNSSVGATCGRRGHDKKHQKALWTTLRASSSSIRKPSALLRDRLPLRWAWKAIKASMTWSKWSAFTGASQARSSEQSPKGNFMTMILRKMHPLFWWLINYQFTPLHCIKLFDAGFSASICTSRSWTTRWSMACAWPNTTKVTTTYLWDAHTKGGYHLNLTFVCQKKLLSVRFAGRWTWINTFRAMVIEVRTNPVKLHLPCGACIWQRRRFNWMHPGFYLVCIHMLEQWLYTLCVALYLCNFVWMHAYTWGRKVGRTSPKKNIMKLEVCSSQVSSQISLHGSFALGSDSSWLFNWVDPFASTKLETKESSPNTGTEDWQKPRLC